MNLSWETIAVCLPLLAMLAIAAATDLTARRIPNWLTLTVALAGLAQSVMPWGTITPARAVLGMALGFTVTFLLYILGGRGAGDVKLTAGIGAWLGPLGVLVVLMAAAVVSLVLALGQSFYQGRLRDLFGNSALMVISLLNVRRLGAQTVIETGKRGGRTGRPLPNAVCMCVATVGVVLWAAAGSTTIVLAR